MALFSNSVRIGRYQVLDLLGSGGMGDVYLVREEGSGALWALKTLRAGGPESETYKRFMNEGRVHSELRHPNIAAFREMFLYEERPCLIMEYVDGDTLFSRIQHQGRLPVDHSLQILSQVCDALSHLHSRNIIHRDLKSANVKVNSSGHVKLLDFGIAKYQRAPGMTMVGAVMGTPEYLAPELILGHPASVRSEVWTLGLLAYEMLTGRLPFNDASEAALYESIRFRDPWPPSHFHPQVPPAVDALVARSLEKKASSRFASPADLQKAIARATGGGAWSRTALESEIHNAGAAVEKTARHAATRFQSLPPRTRLLSAGALATLFLLWFIWAVSGAADSQSITIEAVEGTADVYENGSRVGRTPYRRKAKAGELVQVELHRPGYVDQPVQFEVTERKVYSYTMQRALPPQ